MQVIIEENLRFWKADGAASPLSIVLCPGPPRNLKGCVVDVQGFVKESQGKFIIGLLLGLRMLSSARFSSPPRSPRIPMRPAGVARGFAIDGVVVLENINAGRAEYQAFDTVGKFGARVLGGLGSELAVSWHLMRRETLTAWADDPTILQASWLKLCGLALDSAYSSREKGKKKSVANSTARRVHQGGGAQKCDD